MSKGIGKRQKHRRRALAIEQATEAALQQYLAEISSRYSGVERASIIEYERRMIEREVRERHVPLMRAVALRRERFVYRTRTPSAISINEVLLQLSPDAVQALRSEVKDSNGTNASSIDSLTRESSQKSKPLLSPQLGERLLLLILTKEERVNIPGDLEEEFKQIAAKHGARYAKLWYYKQVAASAWPMIRKAVRWGLLASIGEWVRRII